jgi:DNA-binding MarR family transcriptional regulator
MTRVAWVLLILLALPLVGAQAELRPSLTLDPARLTAAPGDTLHVDVVVANPTGDAIAFTLHATSETGVKFRFDRTDLVVAPGARERAVLSIVLPEAAGVTHVLAIAAVDEQKRSDVGGKLEILVPAAPASLLVLSVEPRLVDIPRGGSAPATITIENPTRADVRFGDGFRFALPPGIRAEVGPHPPFVPGGGRVSVPLTLFHDGDAPSDIADAKVGLGPAAPSAFAVRVVDAPLAPPGGGVLVVAAGAAALAGAVGGGIYLARRHWLLLLGLLYTRLRPSNMLDQPIRRRIVDAVQQHPGLTFSDLARTLDIAPGQLTHHARMLEKAGIVFSSPDGQTRRFFHVGGERVPAVPPLADRAMALLHERPWHASDLARELGVSRQSLHYHVKQLVAQRRLVTRVDGRDVWIESV